MTAADASNPVDSLSPSPANNPRQHYLRLWPGIVLVAIIGLARVWALTGEMLPQKFFFGLVVAPAIVTIALLLWWLLASRLRWSDRLLGVGVFLVTATATVYASGKNFPAIGLIMFVLPVLCTIWVAWLLVTFWAPWSVRRAGMLLIFIATGIFCSLIRVDGMDGSFAATFNWRWTPTPEDKLLGELQSVAKSEPTADQTEKVLTLSEGDWPCFRGPDRDSKLAGVRIATDWEKSPPKEVWKHRIGPGWSSCAVIGNYLFTQEQRGDEELVVCYDTETGSEIWSHHDKARFEEVVAGAGPRGTPTFHEGRIYAMGATGLLTCLDAATGKQLWQVDILKDSKAKVPQWGFSGSPLICRGLVSVFAGGPDDKCVVAYHAESGEFAWGAGRGPKPGEGAHSYCSTQLATMDGVEQILIATNVGLTSIEPEKGTVLWEHEWIVEQARVVQPAVLNSKEVLLGTGMNGGTRRLDVQLVSGQWKVESEWTTKSIKPYYNDLVISNNHLFGFDNSVFVCVNAEDGKLKWRARGYGNGQVLLLADQGLLLILTETGEVALLEANLEKHVELARIKGITGKTWNHPTIAHGKLFIRNGEEIACFTMPVIEAAEPVPEVTAPATDAK